MSSKQVDQRVVEMQFDNKQFEDGVQESISTLDKLKKALRLEDAAEGFSELERAANDLDVSGASSAVEKLGEKISWLEQIGIGALRRLGEQGFEKLKDTIKSFTLDPVKSGFDKYGDKTRQVATIMSATGKSVEEVNDQLEKLMWYTDETSYTFTDMAANIGKFTSNGVALETAVTAMMGIGNWAGLAGSNAQEASRAMYNLSQAISVGEVKLMDWKSIENAGMATSKFKEQVIDTAVSIGMLTDAGDGLFKTLKGNEVSVTNFNENLADGWFTSEVLLKTLDKFGDYTEEVYKVADQYKTCAQAMEHVSEEGMELGAAAFKSAQEARTAGDAIEATTEAVASQFMTMFEIIFGSYDESKVLWTKLSNDLWNVFAGPIASFNELIGPAFETQWEDIGDKILETGVNAEDFENRLKEAARAAGLDVDGLIEKYGSLTKSLRTGWLDSGKLGKILDDILGDTERSTVKTAKSIANLEEVVYDVIRGDYANNWSEANRERERLLTEAGYDAKLVQDLVNKVMWGEDVDFNVVIEDQLESLGYTKEQIEAIKELREELKNEDSEISKILKGASGISDEFAEIADMSGRELLFGSITNILQSIQSIVSAIGAAFRDIFPETTSRAIWEALGRIYLVTQKIREFFGKLATEEEEATGIAEQLRRVFRGLFAVLHVGAEAVKAVVGGISKLVSFFLPSSGAVGGLLDFAGGFADILVSFDKFITESSFFKKAVNGIVTVVTGILTPVKKAIEWVFVKIMNILTTVIGKVGEAFNWFTRNTSRAVNFLTEAYQKLRDAFTKFLDNWKKTNTINLEPFVEAFSWIGEKLSKAFSKIIGVLNGDGSSASATISTIFEKIGAACHFIVDGFQKIISYISPVAEKFWEILTAGNGLGEAWGYLGEKFKSFIEPLKEIGLVKAIGPYFEQAASGLKKFGSHVVDYITSLGIIDKAKSVFSSISDSISKSLADGFKSFKEGKDYVKEVIKGIIDSLRESINSISFVPAIKEKLEPIVDTVKDIVSRVIEAIKEFIAPASSMFEGVFDSVKNSIENSGIYKSITSVFGPKVEKTIEKTSEAVDKTFKSFGGAGGGGSFVNAKIGPITNGINGLNKIVGTTPKFLDEASDSIEDFSSGSVDAAEELTGFSKAFYIAKTVIGNVISGIGKGIKYVVESIKKFGSTIKQTFDSWKSQNRVALQPILDTITRVKDSVKDFFKSLGSSADSEGGEFKSKLSGLFTSAGEIFKPFLDALSTAYNFIAPKIKAVFDVVKDVVKTAFKSIFASISKMKFSDLFRGIEAAFGTAALVSITKFFKSFASDTGIIAKALQGLFGSAGGLFSGISSGFSGMFDGLTGTLKSFQRQIDAEAIKKIGEAVLVLAGAIAVLAIASKYGDVEKAAVIVGVLAAELSGILIVFQKFGKGSSAGLSKEGISLYSDASKSIFMLGSALLMMAGAVMMLGKLKPEELGWGMAAMTGLIIELTAAIKLIQKGSIVDSDKQVAKASGTIIVMALALLAMVKVVKKLGNMDPIKLLQGMGALTGIMTGIIIMFRSLGKSEDVAIKAGLAIKAIGTSLLLMSVAMKIIGSMEPGDLAKSLISLGLGLTAMVVALKVLSKDGMDASGAGTALASLSLGLVGLAVGLKILASIGVVGLAIAIGGMAVALTTLVGVAVLAQKAKIDGTLKTLAKSMAMIGVACLGLGAGLLAAATALILLGTAGSAAVVGLTILGKMIVVMVKEIIRSVIESIGELGGVLAEAILSLVQAFAADDRTYEIVKGLVEILIQLLVAVFDGIAENAPRLVNSFVNMLSSLGSAIGDAFRNFDIKDVLIGTGAIAVLVASMKVLSKCKSDIKGALIVAGTLILIATAFTGLFLLMGQIDGVNALIQATAISEVMLAMSAALKIMQGLSVTSAWEAIKAFDLMLADLVVVLTTLGALDQIPGFRELLDSGGQILIDIGSILGEAVGAIVGGLLEGISDGLPGIGENLDSFFGYISSGLSKIAWIKEDTFNNVKTLAEAMLLLTASELIDGISRFLGGGQKSLVDFAKQLEDFAPHIVAYATALSQSGLSIEDIEKSATAGKILAEFAKAVPKEGGLWQDIAGSTNLEHFGEQLENFAPHLVAYAETIKGLTPDMIQGSVDAAQLLVDLANKIPSTGGLLQGIMGEKDLSDFGNKLKALGDGLLGYVVRTIGISKSHVAGSASALEVLIALNNDLPETGGLMQRLGGEKDLEEFGNDLEALGAGLVAYSEQVANVDGENVAATGEGIKALIGIGQAFAEADTGYFDMGDFGEKMNILGGYYAEFYKSVSRTVAKKVIEAIEVIGQLADVAGSQNGGKLESLANALNELSQVTLDSMVESFNGAGENVKGVGTTIVNDLVTGITEGATSSLNLSLVKGCGVSLANELLENITPTDEELSVVAVGMISLFTSSIKGEEAEVGKVAQDLAIKFSYGISSGSAKLSISNAAGEIISAIKTKLSGYYNDFKSLGDNVVLGFARGITENTYKAKAAAAAMAEAAKKSAERELDEHSPSKVFAKIGRYCVLGFVKGITDDTKLIDKTVTKTFGKRLTSIAQAQVDTFAKVYKKNGVKKVAKEAEKSLRSLGTTLYQQTDGYKESKKQLKEYNKELAKLQKEQDKLAKQGKKDTKDYKENAKKIKEVQKNITATQKQAIKDAQAAFNDYYNGIKDQTKDFLNILDGSFDSQIDLFQRFEKEHKITARNILRNMHSQIDGVNEWKANLTKLGKTGIADGLLQKLKDMGPSGAAYVEAFLKMSKKQIKEANKLFAEEQAIANKNFLANAKAKITEVKNWAAGISALAAKGLNKGLLQNLIDKGPEGYEYVQAFLTMSAKEIKDLNKTYSKTLSVPKAVANEIVAAYTYAGTESAKGFAKGIEQGKAKAINAAVKLANEALKAAKKRLGIKSPSKEFAKIGDFAGEGFTNALNDYADRSYEAGTNIADSAEAGLNDAISKIVDIIAGDVDSQPTITPILDLTNVYDGMGELDTLFGGSDSIFATNATRNALLAQGDITGNGMTKTTDSMGNTVYNFNQYNSSPKALSRLDIYRQTRNQFAMMKGAANA